MLNEILSALVAVATLQNLLIMVAGIWGGVIVGAILTKQQGRALDYDYHRGG